MAACYEETASLTINGGTPSTGRAELAATARSYMDAFPDLGLWTNAFNPPSQVSVLHPVAMMWLCQRL